MKCFNCDEDGHLAYQCGMLAATMPERPPDSLALYRRASWEISKRYTEWADQIRAEMGWTKGQGLSARRQSLAELASQQVSESRAARVILP